MPFRFHRLALLASALVLLLALPAAAGAQTPVYLSQWGSMGSGPGQFMLPEDVAVDAAGNVYVADTGNHRIQKFTSAGVFLAEWGSQGSAPGQFESPISVSTDAAGNVYVADTGNHRVQKFTDAGAFLTQWGSQGWGDGQFHTAFRLEVDASDRVFVVDETNYRIQIFTSDGTYLDQWGTYGSGPGEFDRPFTVTFDGAGTAYVTDSGNHRIQKFTDAGAYLGEWSGFSPRGIAVDGSDDVFAVVGNIEHRTDTGAYVGTVGTGHHGSGPGDFDLPMGLALDDSGNLYGVDSRNHRVQKFGEAPVAVEPATWGRVKTLY